MIRTDIYELSASRTSARLCAHCAQTYVARNMMNFQFVSKYDWAGARFPRAQPRPRPSCAHQSIFLITKMLFDYFINYLILKVTKIQKLKVHEYQKILSV